MQPIEQLLIDIQAWTYDRDEHCSLRPAIKWFYSEPMKVYCRINRARSVFQRHTCVDIANVIVYEQGKGTFTKFLDGLEAIIDGHGLIKGIYVENVFEKRFGDYLERRGYTPEKMYQPYSYWLALPRE